MHIIKVNEASKKQQIQQIDVAYLRKSCQHINVKQEDRLTLIDLFKPFHKWKIILSPNSLVFRGSRSLLSFLRNDMHLKNKSQK